MLNTEGALLEEERPHSKPTPEQRSWFQAGIRFAYGIEPPEKPTDPYDVMWFERGKTQGKANRQDL